MERAARAEVALPDALVEQLETYYRLLDRWNQTINLTALRTESLDDRSIDRLLIEPLMAARYLAAPSVWVDLGSGGGSPALPMKMVHSATRLTMVEARSRKAAFLREAVRALSLPSTEVMNDRFEQVAARPDMAGMAEFVTVRAVRMDDALLRSSRHLLKSGGDLFLFTTQGSSIDSSSLFESSRSITLLPGGQSELVVLKAR
jgi:16S rRNA (guanine527-N7)-methyltransferase